MPDSMQQLPPDLASPVAVVCHDAGAANLIFAWLGAWSDAGLLGEHDFRLLLQGPAKTAWLAKPVALPRVQMHSDLHEALQGAKCVLTGTGWASTLEHQARQLAIDLHMPAIAVIDHWVNYAQRFEREGAVVLPHAIWVSDPYAADMVTTMFRNVPVLELPNVYLQEMVKTIPPVQDDCRSLLYVLEPLRNDWGKGVPGEFQALNFFAENVRSIVGNQPVRMTLRPHPSDPPGKYNAWMQVHADLSPSLDPYGGLNEAIANARWVVGAETFAMVVAVAAGRPTFSSLPPWAQRCRLPQDAIIHLRDVC